MSYHCVTLVCPNIQPSGHLSEGSGAEDGVWWLGTGAGCGESIFLVNGYFPIEFESDQGDFRLKGVLEAKTQLAGE